MSLKDLNIIFKNKIGNYFNSLELYADDVDGGAEVSLATIE